MIKKRHVGVIAPALFFIGLAALWVSNGKGVIKNDPENHIAIPSELLMPLQVRASYNHERIFFQYRWPAEQPSYLHDVFKFEGGSWKRYGDAVPGSEPHGLHEDRVAMMIDDGSIPDFARYGGYITIGTGLAEMSDEASSDEVKNHPYLGQQRGQDGVTKYLPQTRNSPEWADTADADRIKQLRAAGYFLDLWHWRSARGNPLNISDDQLVHDVRDGDSGRSAWFTNWDAENNQPLVMFNPDVAGHAALNWDVIQSGQLDPNSIYYLHESTMQPFDPDHEWQEGDVLPRRALRTPEGSRSDIAANAYWADGYWNVSLSRMMDTQAPLDDKIFVDGGKYSIAFSVHKDATGGRWHYISMPISLGLGRDAQLSAYKETGEDPLWLQDWHDVTLFYPGQVTWSHLTSKAHAGNDDIAKKVPAMAFHNEEQLAIYGVESEFRKPIQQQWYLTLFSGLFLFAAIGLFLYRGVTPTKGVN